MGYLGVLPNNLCEVKQITQNKGVELTSLHEHWHIFTNISKRMSKVVSQTILINKTTQLDDSLRMLLKII